MQSFHHGRSKLIKSSKLFLKIRKKSINFVWSHEHASSYVLPYRFFKRSVSNFRIKYLDEFSRNQSSSWSKSHAPKICQYGLNIVHFQSSQSENFLKCKTMYVNEFCIIFVLAVTYPNWRKLTEKEQSLYQKYINLSNTIKIHKNQNFAAEEKMHYMVIFYESWSLAMIRNGPTVR